MLTAPSLARSESLSRSKVSPRLIEVSGTNKFSSPSTEVFISAPVSNSEYAQTRNLNLQTSRPFVLGKPPRGTPQLAKKKGGKEGGASERPNTSGGTSATASSTSWNQGQWENLRKNRESKDDTYFALMKGNKVERSEITANSFPMPIALPTPDATPPRGPSPEEPLIGELIQMNYQDQNGSGIGMALGSPTHPQNDWAQSQSPYRVNTNDLVQESKRPNDVVSPVSPPAKQKQSKWKGFGSLFGRKAPKQATNFYQLDGSPPSGNSPELEQNAGFGNSNPTPPDSADSQIRARSNTTSKKAGKQAPTPTRANTAPVQHWRGNKKSDKSSGQPPEIQVDGGPMLDVEIPSIHLDRYSVMFSGVLGKGGIESSSSLLARRQATLDKLKTVNEAIAEKEREEAEAQKKLRTRRATSPQPTKSPAFSLFPAAAVSTPSQPIPRTPTPLADQLRPQNKSGLSRSNTSPAALSPNRSTFHSDAESHIIMLDDGKALLNGISSRGATAKKTVQFSSEESTLMLSPQSMDSSTLPFSPNSQPSRGRRLQEDSSTPMSPSEVEETDDEGEIRIKQPLKPKLSEPDWQIINPSESESESGPFKKEIELIDRITSPTTSRGRSRTITQQSVTPSTISTANSSILASPTSDIHPMSPLRSNPPSPRHLASSVSPEPHYQNSTSTSSSSNTTSTSFTTPSSTSPPRRARSIKQIRADLEHRQRSVSRSAQREAQREIERAKVQAELDEAERTLESAAGLSIARQISMSQKQRQLLLPIQGRSASSNSINSTSPHRKPVGSGSISSIVSAGGLGTSRDNDAMLLSSGGFNNPISSPGIRNINGFDFGHYERPPQNYQSERERPELSRQRSGSIKQETSRPELSRKRSGSIQRENGERAPSRSTERAPSRTERERAPSRTERERAPSRTGPAMGSSTMSAGTDSNGRIHSTINMGAMGMGAILKREISHGTPTVVEPDMMQAGGGGKGHRYQRSERVVLDG